MKHAEKKPINELTVRDLEGLIQRIVRQTVREELGAEFEEIAHRPIKGSEFFSLHSGSYRIPYTDLRS